MKTYQLVRLKPSISPLVHYTIKSRTHAHTCTRIYTCSLTHAHTYNLRPSAIPVDSDVSGSGTALRGEKVLDAALVCCGVSLCFACHVMSRCVVRPLVVRRDVRSPGSFQTV